jgi:D-alanyl-D-alanine carboxypeptidase
VDRSQALLDASPVGRTSFWGIRIVDLDQNRTWFESNPNRLFLPASNAKLFTTALALMDWGRTIGFKPWCSPAAAPGDSGDVDALRLVGGGDPNLSGPVIPYRMSAPPGNPLEAIEDLADQVFARGVRVVRAQVARQLSSHKILRRSRRLTVTPSSTATYFVTVQVFGRRRRDQSRWSADLPVFEVLRGLYRWQHDLAFLRSGSELCLFGMGRSVLG